MFCNACGKELQSGQQYCSSCGQPVGVAPIPRSINRVAHHVQLVGIFWVVYALLELMGGIVLFILALTIFSPLRRMEEIGPAAGFLQPLFIAIGIFLLIKAAAGLAAGVGLIQRQPWARILAIVLAIIVLLNIPFGTALGVYTLWTLFSPDSQKEYEGMAGK